MNEYILCRECKKPMKLLSVMYDKSKDCTEYQYHCAKCITWKKVCK